MEKIKGLLLEEEGQGLAEYGLTLAGVVIVVAAAVTLLQGQITELFTGILNL
ncbi:Flp family type IVb pilin [Evansella sp. LMS18]|uniref:Flp family type IVb pilin n=1 Tax=Evansella sp. LMS18 TaxID=2924033 RepID=UPI0020D0F611|nr:Flp family type IVb pilin [Evansella sp. LMS18]UTR11520.1 Flp family type IVb pilin [Evansella sp. LMS18]